LRVIFAKSMAIEVDMASQFTDVPVSPSNGPSDRDGFSGNLEDFQNPHPITVRTQQMLALASPDETGALNCAGEGLFSIRIMPGSEDRLLLLLDTLIKECVARGAALATLSDKSAMDFGGELVGFSIEEPANRRLHRPGPEEIGASGRSSSAVNPAYSIVPSRKFTIRLWPRVQGLRDVWRGVAASKVETRLDAIVSALEHRGPALAEERRISGERRRVEIEQAEEAFRRGERDAAALERLESDAKSWRRARDLNLYLDALEASAAEVDPEWLRWARDQASRIDPLADPSLRRLENGQLHQSARIREKSGY